MDFKLKSTAFKQAKLIPSKYTCEGDDISPPLSWQGVPANTKSLALIIADPDAPDPKAPKMTWIHWIIFNLPPEMTCLLEGVTSKNIPHGTREGLNSWDKMGYSGPCPPIGKHRYFHTLYALDTVFSELNQPTKKEIDAAMNNHIITQTTLMGTYKKSQ